MSNKRIELSGMENEIPCHHHIELLYPEIYAREKTTLTVGMCHTRAADSIRLSYDSTRDGWVIEQASIFTWEVGDTVGDRDWQEVAFIQAWARERPDTFSR